MFKKKKSDKDASPQESAGSRVQKDLARVNREIQETERTISRLTEQEVEANVAGDDDRTASLRREVEDQHERLRQLERDRRIAESAVEKARTLDTREGVRRLETKKAEMQERGKEIGERFKDALVAFADLSDELGEILDAAEDTKDTRLILRNRIRYYDLDVDDPPSFDLYGLTDVPLGLWRGTRPTAKKAREIARYVRDMEERLNPTSPWSPSPGHPKPIPGREKARSHPAVESEEGYVAGAVVSGG